MIVVDTMRATDNHVAPCIASTLPHYYPYVVACKGQSGVPIQHLDNAFKLDFCTHVYNLYLLCPSCILKFMFRFVCGYLLLFPHDALCLLVRIACVAFLVSACLSQVSL